jgi:DNA-binding LacI/PurR family transcriptional regulator
VSAPVSKYKAVEIEVRQLAKTLPVGAKLPAERNLAVTYDCNFLTVRKALKALVDDGTIVRQAGIGTFVAEGAHTPNKIQDSLERDVRIGLLFEQNSDPFAYRLLQGLAHAALESNLSLYPCLVNNITIDGLRHAKALQETGCSAILLPWFPHDRTNDVRQFVQRCPLPVSLPIRLGPRFNNDAPEGFFGDLEDNIEKLCRYHQMLGRRTIAFLGPNTPKDPVVQKMIASYTSFVCKHDMENLGFLVDSTAGRLAQLASRLKDFRGELGIVCYDDQHALRLISAMSRVGLRAPDDYGIVGRNNVEDSHFSDPPLTTINYDYARMSRQLLRGTLELANKNVDRIPLEAAEQENLIVRGSCGGLGRLTPEIRRQLQPLELVEESVP